MGNGCFQSRAYNDLLFLFLFPVIVIPVSKVVTECNEADEVEHEEEEPIQLNHFLKQEEEKKKGAVAFKVYRAYWLAVGSCLALSILLSLLLMQGKLITLLLPCSGFSLLLIAGYFSAIRNL